MNGKVPGTILSAYITPEPDDDGNRYMFADIGPGDYAWVKVDSDGRIVGATTRNESWFAQEPQRFSVVADGHTWLIQCNGKLFSSYPMAEQSRETVETIAAMLQRAANR